MCCAIEENREETDTLQDNFGFSNIKRVCSSGELVIYKLENILATMAKDVLKHSPLKPEHYSSHYFDF